MKKKVLLRAPVLTMSGYGVHARQIFKWLVKKDIDLFIQPLRWGDTPWMINRKIPIVKEIMDRTNMQDCKEYDYSFQLQLPNEWDPKLAKYNVGMSAMVETDICNPEWVDACNKMDCVITLSSHARNVLAFSDKLQKEIHVVPESYVEAIDTIQDSSLMSLDHGETDFNFLVFGQITGDSDATDRKNTFKTLEWICSTFKNDKNVGIVIKTNCGKNTVQDKHQARNMLSSALSRVRTSNFPKVYLIHGSLEDEEVASLYKNPKIKALVSLTKGEGFGLPILEAAASDLPVIATNWSGHLDFMNRGKFIKIDYDLQEVNSKKIDNKIFMKGSKWAQPREIFVKKALKKFRSSHEIPEQWAVDLGKTLREEYSQSSVEKKYDELFASMEIKV